MRVIGGSAKGSQIFSPKGLETRPTQDRIRESLFNILQGVVQGAKVLDLFAGSGALALEAVSRGAEQAVAVDHAQDAVVCIQRNIAKLGFEDRMRVFKCDWRRAVKKLQNMKAVFDLVFLDPPYRMTDSLTICENMAQGGLLERGAWVVIEHRRGVAPALSEPFRLRNTRIYGDTEISFFVYLGQVEGP